MNPAIWPIADGSWPIAFITIGYLPSAISYLAKLGLFSLYLHQGETMEMRNLFHWACLAVLFSEAGALPRIYLCKGRIGEREIEVTLYPR